MFEIGLMFEIVLAFEIVLVFEVGWCLVKERPFRAA